MRHVWLFQMICRSLPLWLLLAATSASAQETTINQQQYEQERRILAEIELLRQLHSEGRFEEVIANADRLMSIDPNNQAARVWKDRAIERMQREGSQFPDPSQRPDLVAPEVINPEIPETQTGIEQPVAMPDFKPVPLSPRAEETVFAGSLSPLILIGLGIVALIFLAIAVFAWLRVRASQKQLSDAIAAAEKKRTGQRDDLSFSDRPTSVHDAVTQIHGHDNSQGAAADEDSVMQFGEVGVSDETGEDYPNNYRNTGALEDDPTISDYGYAGDQEQTQFDDAPATEVEEDPLFASLREAPQTEAPEDSDSLGITDDFFEQPSPEQPQEDPNEMSFNSLMFENDETVMPPASPQPEKTQQPNDDAMSFNSMMFSGASETKSTDDEAQAETGVSQEDPDALTFNSLMFSGSEETKLSGGQQDDTAMPGQQAAAEPGEMTFNSVMFGGNDETVAPTGAAPPAPQGDQNEDQTVLLPGMTGDSEATIGIDTFRIEDDSTDEKFEEEKTAGIEALSRGDFKTAVQSLSVAAGLRPEDKGVTEKLAEARSKRDQ